MTGLFAMVCAADLCARGVGAVPTNSGACRARRGRAGQPHLDPGTGVRGFGGDGGGVPLSAGTFYSVFARREKIVYRDNVFIERGPMQLYGGMWNVVVANNTASGVVPLARAWSPSGEVRQVREVVFL